MFGDVNSRPLGNMIHICPRLLKGDQQDWLPKLIGIVIDLPSVAIWLCKEGLEVKVPRKCNLISFCESFNLVWKPPELGEDSKISVGRGAIGLARHGFSRE